jgi:hypothetical protein
LRGPTVYATVSERQQPLVRMASAHHISQRPFAPSSEWPQAESTSPKSMNSCNVF